MTIIDIFIILVEIFTVVIIINKISTNKFDILAFTVYLLSFFFIFRPIILVLGIDYPHTIMFLGKYYHYQIRLGMAYFLLWIWVLSFSYILLIPFSYWLTPLFPKFSLNNDKNLTLMNKLFIFSDLMIFAIMMYKAKNFTYLINSARTGDTLLGIKFLTHLPYLGSLLSTASMTVYLQQKAQGKNNPKIFKYSLATLMLGITHSIIISERSGIFFPVFLLFLQYMIFIKKSISYKKLALVFGVSVVMLTVMYLGRLNLLRYKTFAFSVKTLDYSMVHTMFLSVNISCFDNYILVLQDYKEENYRKGEDFITGMKGIIPRAMWKNKPTDIHPGDSFRRMYLENSRSGWPVTVIGEWYMNFGIWGIFYGAILSGIVLRSIKERSKKIDSPFTLIYVFIAANHVFVGGFIAQSIMQYILWIIPLHFIAFLTSRKITIN
jgi:oligosaccharide repeat unit polymerase